MKRPNCLSSTDYIDHIHFVNQYTHTHTYIVNRLNICFWYEYAKHDDDDDDDTAQN